MLFVRKLLLAASAFTPFMPALAAPIDQVPLISREALFSAPVKSNGKISPDGKWLSWTAPVGGVLNLYVAPVGNPSAAKQVTAEKERPVREYYWSPDSSRLLFLQDKGGDENFLLYGVDVATGRQVALTPFAKTRAQVQAISPHHPDRIIVGLNNRDAKWHDLYSLNLKTSQLTLLQRNPGYGAYVVDDQFVPRIAVKSRDDGGSDYFWIHRGTVDAKPFGSVGLEDSLTTNPVRFTADGKTLYWIDSRGRNTAALLAQNSATGKTTVLGESARADVGDLLTNPTSGVVEAYSAAYLKPSWTPLDGNIGKSLAWLEHQLGAVPLVLSRSDDDSKWVVAGDPVVRPTSTFLFDRVAGSLTKLYTGRPQLEGAPLQPMWPVEIKARDGQTLPSYLTLPATADMNHDGKADGPVPMVLFVHGGPWARDDYGYFTAHQWLANRGYAVLSVNYRGSTGFGKSFISAGDLQWGKAMQTDLNDAVDWAVSQGVTTADKVAIMGGSYGGYATLAGVTLTPKEFRCGVDIVGPSNLFTLLQTIPPYWEAVKQQFYKRMGDPTTVDGRALLKSVSPLTYADRIERPLLIGQGANDPRVNVRESDQIVAAMKAKNIPVTYVLFPDEGHGFARPVNNIAFFAISENFLKPCLGGRAEPIGGALKPSSARILEGAQYVSGLARETGSK